MICWLGWALFGGLIVSALVVSWFVGNAPDWPDDEF